MTSKISVCMATYNGEKYIRAQVDSILKQLSPQDELIVSDDHSTDKTIEIVNNIQDKRIVIIYNKLEKGYSGNFENAIINATGDIIFLSDQDDVWLDDKVNEMTHRMNDAQMVVCNAQFVDKDLNPMDGTYFGLRGGKQGLIYNLYKSRYLGSCMAFRRELLVKLLPFPSRRDLCPHDLWITLIAEMYFKVKIINKSLMLYRRHDNNVSSGGNLSKNNIYQKIFFRGYSLSMALSRLAV